MVKQDFYKLLGKQYGLLCILNHSTLSQSELIQTFFISYDTLKAKQTYFWLHFSML